MIMRMLKSYFVSCALFAFMLGCCHSDQSPAPATTQPAITVDLLDRVPVMGKLGVPLGTPVEIRATVIAGRELRYKRFDRKYLLRVTEVGGKSLSEPCLLEFSIAPGSPARIAPDEYEFYKMKNGNKASQLDYSEQIRKFEESYVGKVVHLSVYETGWFGGTPRGMAGMWQDRSFNFSSWLMVLTEM